MLITNKRDILEMPAPLAADFDHTKFAVTAIFAEGPQTYSFMVYAPLTEAENHFELEPLLVAALVAQSLPVPENFTVSYAQSPPRGDLGGCVILTADPEVTYGSHQYGTFLDLAPVTHLLTIKMPTTPAPAIGVLTWFVGQAATPVVPAAPAATEQLSSSI